MTGKDYLRHVKKICLRHGVKLTLSKTRRVLTVGEGNGYFSDDPAELVVAMKQPKRGAWLQVLVHEAGHLDQWIDFNNNKNVILWKRGDKKGEDVYALLDNWTLRKIKLSRRQVLDLVRRIIAIEFDCEKRALKNIIKHKLPIDTAEYVQQAYAYLFSYFIIAERREWYSKEPYYIKLVVDQMPTKLNKDPEREWKKYKDLMIKHCWKN